MTPLREPVGPKGSWLSGNLPDFRKHRLDFLTRCAREYGDIVKLRFAHRIIYLACHPDLIEEVLVTHSKNFIKHFALRLNPLVLGNGLLTSEGDFWLRQRRLMQPVFNRSRILSYAAAMVDTAERLLGELAAGDAARHPRGDDAPDARHRRPNAVRNGCRRARPRRSPQALEVDAGKFSAAIQQPACRCRCGFRPPPTSRMRRAVEHLDAVLYRIIRERRQSRRKTEQGDLLSLLLQARDEETAAA